LEGEIGGKRALKAEFPPLITNIDQFYDEGKKKWPSHHKARG